MTNTRSNRTLQGPNRALLLVETLLVLAFSSPTFAQGDVVVSISAPTDGDVLTGVAQIQGTVSTDSFLSADLAFAYAGASDGQWFEIAQVLQPTNNAQLAIWDTTTISDGDYILRLRVNGTDGTVRDDVVRIQIRNYTAAPITATAPTTPSPQPILQVPSPIIVPETPTALRPPLNTPTALPANPVGLTRQDIWQGLARGGLAILAVFLLVGAVVLRRRT